MKKMKKQEEKIMSNKDGRMAFVYGMVVIY